MIQEKRDHCRPHQTRLETVNEGTEIHLCWGSHQRWIHQWRMAPSLRPCRHHRWLGGSLLLLSCRHVRESGPSAPSRHHDRERESRRRREATATEGTSWGRRHRIQCRRCGCLLLPSCGRHGHLESARWRWMRRIGGTRMRRIGGTGMRRRYGGWRWIGRGKLPRAPKSSACARHRLLPAGSKRAVASRRRGRTTEPPPSLPPRSTGEGRRLVRRRGARGTAKRGVSCKKAHHGDGKKTPLYMP